MGSANQMPVLADIAVVIGKKVGIGSWMGIFNFKPFYTACWIYRLPAKSITKSTGISTALPCTAGSIATQEFKAVQIANILLSSNVIPVIVSITVSKFTILISYVFSITLRSPRARSSASSWFI
jgi:hypothetical protein